MLFHKNSEEKFIKNEKKKIDTEVKKSLRMAGYAAELNKDKAVFEQVIRTERLNALDRRDRHLSDSQQKQAIHDSVVGLLAVEEAQFDLKSLNQMQDLSKAMGELEKMLRKMYRLSHYVALNGKEVKNSLGMEFDDTVENVSFSDRAELVDEHFVERLIQGKSLDECLEMATHPAGTPETLKRGMEGIDFSQDSGEKYDINKDKQLLQDDI